MRSLLSALSCASLVACAAAPPPEMDLCPPPSRPAARAVARPRPRAVVVARVDDAIAVPREAVAVDVQGAHVYVAIDGRARRRSVVLGSQRGVDVQIAAGLGEGDRVLLPARLARDGDDIDAAP